MNLQQAGCPDGQGRDLWFRLPTDVSSIPCESAGAYTGVMAVILILNMCLLVGCFLGMIFTPVNVQGVRRNFAFCFAYLFFNAINLWLALTHKEFTAFMSQGAPLALFGAAMSVYFMEAISHYKDMEQLNKKLLGNLGDSSLGKTFVDGIRNALGKDTVLDKLLLSACAISLGSHAVIMIILVPVAPMPATRAWYEPGGSLFQKDFFVSLGIWMLIMVNSFLILSALLLMRRLSKYLSQHASSQQRASKDGDATTEWIKKLDALRRKINITISVTFFAFFIITGFLAVMSMERLLGMRWWAVLIVINLMGTIQSAFNLSTSFPSKQLKKKFPCLEIILASKSTTSSTPADDSKQSKIVDNTSPTSAKSSTMRTTVISIKDIAPAVDSFA